ncbi:hypothetical protein B2J86_09880 [Acidovorax sp. SRB_14]|nr:hypothetical protein [Acidovorax sp. SRB_14]
MPALMPESSAPPRVPPDYAAFLRRQLPAQQCNVASYTLDGEEVWLKKAGPRHGLWRYHALGALAGLARLPVLHPVPNLGGRAAIATEARRLRELGALGLRVPPLLAVHADGLLLRHLGAPGQPTPSLAHEIEAAVVDGPAAVQALWQQGLDALAVVHGAGSCLSQAFARNLVRCPDGVVGYIDFEDDPARTLPLAHCQARDALCYVHSTALSLVQGGALGGARALWARWLAQRPPALRAALDGTVARMGWLRYLPASQRLGRDLQRARAAHDVLSA